MTTVSVIGAPSQGVLDMLARSASFRSAEEFPGELGGVPARGAGAHGSPAPDGGQADGLAQAPAARPGAEASPVPRPDGRMPLTAHGGAVAEYRERFGAEPLDFSANVNPYGISPLARHAAAAALDDACAYPDPACRELRRALGAHLGVDPAWVLPGNGAADVIWRLAAALRPRRALVLAPTFSEYELALRAAGCKEVVRFGLVREDGFVPGDDLLGAVEGADVAFVCNPNNPTGVTAPASLLERLAHRCEELGCVLVVDECFNGFLDDPDAHTVRPLLADLAHLVVLGAFTKLYGMAGLRLGYLLCSDAGLLERVRAAGQAWPVSSVAQAAGVAALGDEAFVARTRRLVSAERARLAEGLSGLGLEVVPGEANYLFFTGPRGLYEAMAARGVIIRDCRSYEGLEEGDYRVAVRLPRQNDRLVAELRRALEELRGDGTRADERGAHDA